MLTEMDMKTKVSEIQSWLNDISEDFKDASFEINEFTVEHLYQIMEVHTYYIKKLYFWMHAVEVSVNNSGYVAFIHLVKGMCAVFSVNHAHYS